MDGEFLHHDTLRYEWMRRRAVEIMLGLADVVYSPTPEELAQLETGLFNSLPTDPSGWTERDLRISNVIQDPRQLYSFYQTLRREADMLSMLEAEGSFALPPDRPVS